MAGKLRVEYGGAIYHVLNRGDRREPIFQPDRNRALFRDALAKTCQTTGWQVHALYLMPNHFHKRLRGTCLCKVYPVFAL